MVRSELVRVSRKLDGHLAPVVNLRGDIQRINPFPPDDIVVRDVCGPTEGRNHEVSVPTDQEALRPDVAVHDAQSVKELESENDVGEVELGPLDGEGVFLF